MLLFFIIIFFTLAIICILCIIKIQPFWEGCILRTKIFIKNSFVIVFSKLICYLIDFLCRTVLIHTLPQEYVGVTGLFSNILGILSLSELGFGTVLVYSMYVPLAQNDEDKLLALTNFYKKAYRMISILVGTMGVLITPFLPYVINNCPDIPGLSVFYLLYLANLVSSYAFVYRQSLFMADQKLYVTNFYTNLLRIVRTVLQIIILITTHNFLLYLLVLLPFTILTNLFLSWKAGKEYPFLNSGRRPILAGDEKKKILKNVYAMFNHRVGIVVLNGTDNLLISYFFGLMEVSRNDSYVMLQTLLRSIFGTMYSSLNASVGNYHATKSGEETHTLFEALHFAGFWFYTFCSACFFLLVNPFISLFWGEEYLFPLPIVLLISANFYVFGIRQMTITFKEAMGLIYQDRYKPIAEALINLVLSILLAKPFGIAGIFMGTFLSMVCLPLWVEPYVLMHYGFHKSTKTFWSKNIRYLLVGTLGIALSWLCSLPFELPLLAVMGIRILLCLTIPNLIFLLFFFKTPEFQMLTNILKQFVNQLIKKFFKR